MEQQLFGLFLFLFTTAQAQSAPEIICAAGHSGNTVHAWTVGEPLVTTISNNLHQLTQGFHQPQLTLLAAETPPPPDPMAYPNPTTGLLKVEWPADYGTVRTVEVYALTGHKVREIHLETPQSQLHLDLSDLAAGKYILGLRYDHGELRHRIPIIKLNR